MDLSTLTLLISAPAVVAAQARQAAQVDPQAASVAAAPAPGVRDDAVRPFRVHVPEAEIAGLRRRIAETRWPSRETVADRSQGPQLAQVQSLVRYWGTRYDWRKGEARLNAFPQFTTTIDGVDIHFIHVRSRHPNAMPMIITHGWPGSVFEQIKLIEPLTDPTRFGGRAEDAFDVVIPSVPGYGFSSQPAEAGWNAERIGRAWDVLMKRLGYTRYVAQGGDWGAVVVEAIGRQAPTGLLGIHTNLPAALLPDVGAALARGEPAPASFTDEERTSYNLLRTSGMNRNLAYVTMMGARPQAVGYGLTDSPAGLAGWMLVHPGFARWSYGADPGQTPTIDEVLDDFTLYWLTSSSASAARLYWENAAGSLISSADQKSGEIRVPVAISVFPDEVFLPPESWARRAFPTLSYYHRAERGGHFAAWEYPEIFAAELRAAFRPLR
jgi:pimeloyl-ACP methyl ester carboxylesterase